MILLTGGAGFIGCNIARGLNAAGEDRIIVVDDLKDGHKHLNLSGVSFADFIDKDDLPSLLDDLGKLSAVIHQGACTDTTEHNGAYMMRTNYDYSKRLLAYCERTGTPFLYASSASVYGLGKSGFSEQPACEAPLNVYGFSKLCFDNFVRRRLPVADCQIVGLRYFNVFGPGEAHKQDMTSVPYKMFQSHKEGRTLQLFEGSDEFLRDFIYVDDVVQVNLHFLASNNSGIFNCGTGKARSFRELGDATAEHLSGAKLETVPMPSWLKGRYQNYTCSDNRLLEAHGYRKSFLSLEDGIARYMRQLEATESIRR